MEPPTDRCGRGRPFWFETDNGWADVVMIKDYITSRGGVISVEPDNNKTDGYVHWTVSLDGDIYEVVGNYWVAETFYMLINWIENGYDNKY